LPDDAKAELRPFAPLSPPTFAPAPPTVGLPTQEGPLGFRYDFNFGARVTLPPGGPWRVRLWDLDSGNLLYDEELRDGWVVSAKRYYIRFKIEVLRGQDLILAHELDLSGREVLIYFPVGTLGDTIAWFSYVPEFQRQHGCRLTCVVEEPFIELFRDEYPEVRFEKKDSVDTARFYATYQLGLFFDDEGCQSQPSDFRLVGLHRTAGHILGVSLIEQPPRVAAEGGGAPIEEPYVCIGVQATSQAKLWNSPTGWVEVVEFLKAAGYRVICIDREPVTGKGFGWNHIPRGAEDQTGDRPLAERARWLKHATAFVGLSSGLSWLAWAVGTPVVLISGFTHPINEFATAYRVINYNVCNSCWNDQRFRFDHDDRLWCPRHAGTDRQFECTRLITAHAVVAALRRIPGFDGSSPASPGQASDLISQHNSRQSRGAKASV
jgi:autotransporter strand-loop-strand O-heptosyltransferase